MAGFAPIYRPTTPFESAILGGIADGRKMTIQGQVYSHAHRFAIDFVCFNNDIAFHFNARYDENALVCNTRQNNIWGSEERKNHLPFQRSANFDVTIVVVGHAFQVTANGQFLLEYRHRIPYQTVSHVTISGDVSLSCVTFYKLPAEMAPVPRPYIPPSQQVTVVNNPVMPFQAAFPKSFGNNQTIKITGYVPQEADRFHVNLLNSGTRNIHLHINPRFNEGTLVRNTKDKGTWGPEEKHLSSMPFYRGQNFQMEIRNEGGVIGVYSNGAKLFTYVHRLPSNQIDMEIDMEIGGNVNLTSVQY